MQVYRDAQRYDAAFSAARNSLTAGRERLPQGRALLLPTLNLSANATRSRLDVDSKRPADRAELHALRPIRPGYTLTFTQPIFRAQNLMQYEQGEFQVRQAEATFGQAEPGPDRARRAGVLRRPRRRRHAHAGARAEGGDLRAAGAGQAQLRGRHRDHHRHARGAGALRPHRRAGDRRAERPARASAAASCS